MTGSWMTRTWSVAQAEWLDSEEDVGGLRNMELVVQWADGPIILQVEAALHVTVMPILEMWISSIFTSMYEKQKNKNEAKSSN